jgi:hypothetical protein
MRNAICELSQSIARMKAEKIHFSAIIGKTALVWLQTLEKVIGNQTAFSSLVFSLRQAGQHGLLLSCETDQRDRQSALPAIRSVISDLRALFEEKPFHVERVEAVLDQLLLVRLARLQSLAYIPTVPTDFD